MMARLPSLLLLAVLVGSWEAWCRLGGLSALILPAPSAVFATLWSEIVTGRLWPHLTVTATEMMLGLGIGAVVGLGVGILLAEFPALSRLLRPYVLASQLVPKLALGPLFIIWFGFGMTPTVVITALICFFPLMENTLTGISEIDASRRELFHMLRAGRLQTLLRLKLPAALPVIMAGLRVAVVLALVGAVVGEFIGGRIGLGASIIAAQSVMDSSLIFALFIVITAMGMLLYEAVRLLERRVPAPFLERLNFHVGFLTIARLLRTGLAIPAAAKRSAGIHHRAPRSTMDPGSALLRSLSGMTASVAVMTALLLSAVTSAQAQTLDKVTVAGWSQPISEITNLLAEPDKGFFKAKGIALDYVPGNGGGAALQTLLAGQADIAFTDPAALYLALDKGEKLVAIYNIYPQNVFNVVALKASGIRTAADLKGKRIGVYSLASGTYQNLLLLLHQVGLGEKDVTIQPTGLLNFAPLMQGQVDATAATDTGLLVARAKGLGEANVIEVRDQLNLPSDIFVVRQAYHEQNKPLLRRFLAAYRDSAAWMIAKPEEAARIAVTRAINGRDEAVNLEIIKLRNASSVSATTEREGLGRFDVEALQKGAETFRSLGLIARPLDMKTVVKSDLIPQKDGAP